MAIPSTFNALVVPEFGKPAEFRDLNVADLPKGDVLVKVEFSSLNYKDGLAVTSKGKILRTFPAVPGIDLAGEVVESSSTDFKPGDKMLATGYGLGENRWGGFSEYVGLNSEWIVPIPSGLDTRRAMAVGTAGFTAMLSIMALEEHGISPDKGEILVTGAAGGAGSVAVAILARLGYHVAASTGRPEEHDYLKALGAAEIIDRNSLNTPTKPLEKGRWSGVIDSVGGATLAHVLSEVKTWGVAAAFGVAGGAELNTTVMPFILRGVTLVGIHSAQTPMERRREAWRRLATDLPLDLLDSLTQTAPFSELPRLAEEILAGQVRGRTVIAISGEKN